MVGSSSLPSATILLRGKRLGDAAGLQNHAETGSTPSTPAKELQ